jgi:hypothetical protein
LLGIEFRFAATSGEMVAAEPGKATTDKEVEPAVNGSQADMQPSAIVPKASPR